MVAPLTTVLGRLPVVAVVTAAGDSPSAGRMVGDDSLVIGGASLVTRGEESSLLKRKGVTGKRTWSLDE